MLHEEVKLAITKAVAKHVPLEDAYLFLFGSRATEHYEPASDYDVGLYTGKPIPFLTLAKIDDELENCDFTVRIDVVDFAVVSADFKKIALKDIQIWNRPKKDFPLI